MEYRILGNTGMKLSSIGFGCASIWGGNLISDKDAINLFEKAYDMGITYYDTGHSYGIAEERIGKVLTNGYVKRDQIVISTKFGTRIVNGKNVHDTTPEWIIESVETSLRRMHLDYIDCLSLHGSKVEDLNCEFFQTLNGLKSRGLVRSIGASTSNNKATLEYINQNDLFDYLFIRYNILNQDLENIIQKLSQKGKGIIAGAPLAESLYSNRVFRIRSKKDVWYLARMLAHFRKEFIEGRKYSFINKVPNLTGTQIALRYVLDNPCITSAVVGTTSENHLSDNVNSINIEIPSDVMQRIKNTR